MAKNDRLGPGDIDETIVEDFIVARYAMPRGGVELAGSDFGARIAAVAKEYLAIHTAQEKGEVMAMREALARLGAAAMAFMEGIDADLAAGESAL